MRMGAGERDALVRAALAMIAALRVRSAEPMRGVRRALSTKLRKAEGADVRAIGLGLARAGHRWMGCEVIWAHREALAGLTIGDVEALGAGMASWEEVDSFGVLVSGAAWLNGAIADADVKRWANSDDFWWRRAALVSTTVLNARSRGGAGDAKRTLMIARLLVDDREDMVVKAMSWALRSLAPWEPAAVKGFLAEHDGRLAARVKREVGNKLRTGLKNPRGGK